MAKQSMVAAGQGLSVDRCPTCSSPIRQESVICLRCGSALRATRTERSLQWLWIGLVLVAMAVVVGIALGLSLQG